MGAHCERVDGNKRLAGDTIRLKAGAIAEPVRPNAEQRI
jgi:hypothetical protein